MILYITAKVNPAVNFSGLSVGPVGSLITAEIFLILFPIGKADGFIIETACCRLVMNSERPLLSTNNNK
jgi:hypothetical protein